MLLLQEKVDVVGDEPKTVYMTESKLKKKLTAEELKEMKGNRIKLTEKEYRVMKARVFSSETIITETAKKYGFSPDDLKSPSRKRQISTGSS